MGGQEKLRHFLSAIPDCRLIGAVAGGMSRQGCGAVGIEETGNELTRGKAQVAQQAAFEAGVILRAAEEIADELAKDGTAAEEEDHGGGDGAAEEGAAIEVADEACGVLEFVGEGGFDEGGVLFRKTVGEAAAKNFSGAHGVEEAFAGERVHPGGGVADEGPVAADDGALGEGVFVGRGEDVGIEARGIGGELLAGEEGIEVGAEFGTGVGGHFSADAHGEMVVAGEGPDVAFKLAEEFDLDGVAGIGNEIALGDFQFGGLEWAGGGSKTVARARGEDQEIGGAPFAVGAIARAEGVGVDGGDAGAADGAAGGGGAVEEEAVEDGAGIDDDGVGKLELDAVVVAGDEFGGVDEFFGK